MSKRINCYVEILQSMFRKTQQQEIRFFAHIIIILYLNILYVNESKMRYNKSITNLV